MDRTRAVSREHTGLGTTQPWLSAITHALPITGLILLLFYHWFAVANRYVIFLYGHLGALAFDDVTRSRYWMAGLVACGVVLAAYVLLNAALGGMARARRQLYRPPAWWCVWLLCAPLLARAFPGSP